MTLIGLGFRSISMSAAAIGPVKAMLGALDTTKLNALLNEELDKPNVAHSLRELMLRFAEDNDIPL
jgi:phosphotransferase system enzyme I (PtsP)